MSESQFEKLLKTLKEKDAEIKRLREENECFEAMKAGVEIRIADLNAKIERLRARSWKISEDKRNIDMSRIEAEDALLYERHEVQRLRELLKDCKPYIAGWLEARELFSEIQKEVGDE